MALPDGKAERSARAAALPYPEEDTMMPVPQVKANKVSFKTLPRRGVSPGEDGCAVERSSPGPSRPGMERLADGKRTVYLTDETQGKDTRNRPSRAEQEEDEQKANPIGPATSRTRRRKGSPYPSPAIKKTGDQDVLPGTNSPFSLTPRDYASFPGTPRDSGSEGGDDNKDSWGEWSPGYHYIPDIFGTGQRDNDSICENWQLGMAKYEGMYPTDPGMVAPHMIRGLLVPRLRFREVTVSPPKPEKQEQPDFISFVTDLVRHRQNEPSSASPPSLSDHSPQNQPQGDITTYYTSCLPPLTQALLASQSKRHLLTPAQPPFYRREKYITMSRRPPLYTFPQHARELTRRLERAITEFEDRKMGFQFETPPLQLGWIPEREIWGYEEDLDGDYSGDDEDEKEGKLVIT
jgi:hypothetical protein